MTVRDFAKFIRDTGYVTVAERDSPAIPARGVPASKAGSAVFIAPEGKVSSRYLDWWVFVPGASWRYPEGPDEGGSKLDHPVTQIAFADALAYADWRGGRLPTEVEWEYASRLGVSGSDADVQPRDANTWQGIFPYSNDETDGYGGVAPAGCFKPDALGLYDMLGNVWEWTTTDYAASHALVAGDGSSYPMKVVKGGSFLCAPSFCARYRPSARQAADTGLGTNHIGFRLAYDDTPEGLGE